MGTSPLKHRGPLGPHLTPPRWAARADRAARQGNRNKIPRPDLSRGRGRRPFLVALASLVPLAALSGERFSLSGEHQSRPWLPRLSPTPEAPASSLAKKHPASRVNVASLRRFASLDCPLLFPAAQVKAEG